MNYNDRILNTARDLFFKFGLRNVTMDDIAREMGMSKRTIYEVYTDKKEIVETITRNFLEHHEQEYLLVVARAKDAVEELLILMEKLNEIFERLNPRMIFDMQRYFPEVWQIFKEHKNNYMLHTIIVNLSRGKREGLFRKEIHEEISALMRLAQIQTSMDPEVFPPDRFTIKEIHMQLLMQYLHGISTLKGHRLINKYLNIKEH